MALVRSSLSFGPGNVIFLKTLLLCNVERVKDVIKS
jgi:hypothetical protein